MSEDLERAESIYVTRALLREGEPSPGLIGIRDLVRLISGRGQSLDSDQTRYLFSQPRLLKIYRALKRSASMAEMPMVAAASDGRLVSRSFDGGVLTVNPQPDGTVVIYVQLDEGRKWPAVDLILTGAERIEKLEFHQAPDEDGGMQEILDISAPRSRAIVDMLADPHVEGAFVRSAD